MDNEIETKVEPAPVKPKRRRVAPRRAAPKAAEQKPSPYLGMTDRTCCSACKEGRCVITQGEFCGRPGLALQPIDMVKPDVVTRRKEAERYLALKVMEDKHAIR